VKLRNLIRPGTLKILLLTVASDAILRTDWWWGYNGTARGGIRLNHFGEPDACGVWVWLLQGFGSPFAWPALVLICLFWWLVLWVGSRLVRRLAN
jgi:hypothetical protein